MAFLIHPSYKVCKQYEIARFRYQILKAKTNSHINYLIQSFL